MSAEAAAPAGSNRRQHPRAPLNAECQVEGVSAAVDLRVSSISEGGAFITNLTMIPAGAPLEVLFKLPGRARPLKLRGLLAYVDTGIGSGVRFVELPDEERSAIRHYVEQQAGARPADSLGPPPSRAKRRELRVPVSLPCRFWIRDGLDPRRLSRGVPSRTVDLSTGGLSLAVADTAVDGLELLTTGSTANLVAVELQLPAPPPVALVGRARWCTAAPPGTGTAYRVGLSIDKLRAADRARILELVNSQVRRALDDLPLPADPLAELPLMALEQRRREARIKVEVEVRILPLNGTGLSPPLKGTTVNLSLGGCCLRLPTLLIEGHSVFSESPHRPPDPLILKLYLPDGEQDAMGAVGMPIWAHRVDPDQLGMSFVIGIRFQNLHPGRRERLQRFLDRLLSADRASLSC
jgi:hypothetical protein